MRSWSSPDIPELPGSSNPPQIFDTASGGLVSADTAGDAENTARLYVCGITPYDSTHLGHAATYLAFDTLQRVWRDAGYSVHYTQNVTDVDDPLLERAIATGVDWRALAQEQTDLFRADMVSLAIIPPDDYVAVTEVVDKIAAAVGDLLDRGLAYRAVSPDAVTSGEPASDDSASGDIYFDLAAAQRDTQWRLGAESNYDRPTMLRFFAERGGDPDRPGKHDALDPLLWRAARAGEPSWPSSVGEGRPGWHIECAVIALANIGMDFTVQGGGADLIFPHHEMSGGHATALSGEPFARIYSHTGMVAYQGEKISKSLGNLVLISRLREEGADPRAIRLALLDHHYRSDWEWTHGELADAEARLALWTAAAANVGDREPSQADLDVLAGLRECLHRDLDAPAALREIDAWATAALSGAPVTSDLVPRAVHGLLGIPLA